ncbi:MAG: pyridoxamine 5'-phosphate oxidase family protein [Pseudomonadales bacterium]|nr:pyridoxamine 5'-phosphate oxidase family protein [Pseudomonadales bacterium]
MSGSDWYHEGMRELQDVRDTRALADRLFDVTVHEALTDDDRTFIEGSSMFFLATADAAGRPDCSYKGGMPGFVRVLDERTLAFPDYDGNGMYRSCGNMCINRNVGLLFIDFEQGRRVRVNGTAEVSADDPLLEAFPGAVLVVRVRTDRVFPNCPRYLHPQRREQWSEYAPREGHAPPPAAWKRYEVFRDALPPRDRPADEGADEGADEE